MGKKEYIDIKLIKRLPKTEVYGVFNKNHNLLLGLIKWYSSWRQYCFLPEEETVFNVGCLDTIEKFIKDLMEKRKK